MDNHLHLQLTFFVHHHKRIIERILHSRNASMMRRLRRSRANLHRMQHIYCQFFGELITSVSVFAVMNIVPIIRTVGKKERSSEWWDREVLQTYDNKQWMEDFRMDRRTFFKLVDLIADDLAVANNRFMEGLSVEKKIAIAVYKLASCAEHRVVGKGFGVSKSTVCVCVHTFCKVFIRKQCHQLLFWPNVEECEDIAQEFEEKYHLPNVIGAIDGTHVPITALLDGGADFHNRKHYASIVVQAVVQSRRLFRDVTAQHPGCTHDASVLRDSHLYRHHQRMIPTSAKVIDGFPDANEESTNFKLPYYIIGDPAYPLSNWIMKNYQHEETADQISFNLYLNKARVNVENAFGHLKGRWRILLKKSDLHVYNMPHIIIAYCMLHNYVELEKQRYLNLWDQYRLIIEPQFPVNEDNLEDEIDAEMDEDHERDEEDDEMDGEDEQVDANLMRDHVCAYMARNYDRLQRRA